ncbi:MAG TPA: 2-aminoethylphosphonate--pyruvate transaminase [Candidatus Phocaeicola excrementigallinarum]|nr:2-aminoethylphosphonate--pyruvate transaminase [Candidatus Phocaeicola excrementigallinarum]
MRPYLLLTPGPLTTSETVKEVMMSDWCTWDEDYNVGIVEVIRKQLVELASSRPEEYTAVLMQGSGTFCVEATLGSVVRPEDHLLVAANGAYGKRMGVIAEYYRLNCHVMRFEETQAVDPKSIGEYLDGHPEVTHVSVVHCETTTGVLNPLEEIAEVVKAHGKVLIVDAMSSFGGVPVDMAALGIDFLISSANKCIQGVPGFGFVIARRSLLEQCKGVARSLSLDLYDQWDTMEKGHGKWRFTSPTHVVRAFMQALKELQTEGGVAARHARYCENHRVLVEGMRGIGFKTLLPDNEQSPVITSFYYPNAGFDFKTFYYALKSKGFVIYPGKISQADTFRIGNIGDVFPTDFLRLIEEVKNLNIKF